MDIHDQVQKRATGSQDLNHCQIEGAFAITSVSTLSNILGGEDGEL